MLKSRVNLIAVLAVSLVVGVWSLTESVAAQSGSGELDDQVVEFYALDFSVSEEEARRRLGRIGPLHVIMASIRDLEDSRVAGWGFDHSVDFGAWVWLTGERPPGEAAARIAAAHGDIEIRTGAAHTYAELRAAQDRFNADSVGQPIGNPQAGTKISDAVVFTGISMDTNSVKIGMDLALADGVDQRVTRAAPEPVSDEDFEAEASSLSDVLRDHIEVAVEVVDVERFGPDADFVGGGAIGGCTAGFAVKRKGGDYGIITAGHCDNDLLMEGVRLPYVYGWASDTADAQFHRVPAGSSHQLLADYKCSDIGKRCDVTGVIARSDMMGRYVCRYGRVSALSCAVVKDINYQLEKGYCLDSDNGEPIDCQAVFVSAEGRNLKGCPGDSGGPVHDASGVAYGIHWGGDAPCKRGERHKNPYMIFSAIGEVEDFLDVEVLTEETERSYPVVEDPPAPAAPSALRGVADSGGVSLSWTEPSGDVAGYIVHRRMAVPGQVYDGIAIIRQRPADHDLRISYHDPVAGYYPRAGLTPGMKYHYRVQAFNSIGVTSDWRSGSNSVSVTTVAPQNIRAVTDSDAISVSWTAAKGDFDTYAVYRRAAVKGQAYAQIARTKKTSYHDPVAGLTPGVEYYYRVKAVTKAGIQGSWGSGSNYASATTIAPQGIRAVVESDQVSVSWTVPKGKVSTYAVYRRAAVKGQAYAQIARTKKTSYYDPVAGLTPGVEYYYRVKAVNKASVQGSWGSGSNYASATTIAPQNIRAVVESDQVSVSWTVPKGKVSTYAVYRRAAVKGQAYAQIARTTKTSYYDPVARLTPGVEYYYRVKAVNKASVQGSWGSGSNYASATTIAPQGIRAVVESDQVSVSWTVPKGDFDTYAVYRRAAVKGQAYAQIARTTKTSYYDPVARLTPGVEYYYRVKAVNKASVQGSWGSGSNYASVNIQ